MNYLFKTNSINGIEFKYLIVNVEVHNEIKFINKPIEYTFKVEYYENNNQYFYKPNFTYEIYSNENEDIEEFWIDDKNLQLDFNETINYSKSFNKQSFIESFLLVIKKQLNIWESELEFE